MDAFSVTFPKRVRMVNLNFMNFNILLIINTRNENV